jgi:hypothetical protein
MEDVDLGQMTIGFGALLALVSSGFFFAMGMTDMASLHPFGLGVLLIVCGIAANTENNKRRMVWMHIAVTVGLIGFLITGVRAVIQIAKGTTAVPSALAFDERVASALICGVFVAMCVRSFIAARKARAV